MVTDVRSSGDAENEEAVSGREANSGQCAGDGDGMS
jgi:hypothetical protein